MTKEDMLEIQRLCNLKQANYADKDSCEALINRYITPGYKFCRTCDPQVRDAFKRLKTWWDEQNQSRWSFIPQKTNS